jgi:hypothetical protein
MNSFKKFMKYWKESAFSKDAAPKTILFFIGATALAIYFKEVLLALLVVVVFIVIIFSDQVADLLNVITINLKDAKQQQCIEKELAREFLQRTLTPTLCNSHGIRYPKTIQEIFDDISVPSFAGRYRYVIEGRVDPLKCRKLIKLLNQNYWKKVAPMNNGVPIPPGIQIIDVHPATDGSNYTIFEVRIIQNTAEANQLLQSSRSQLNPPPAASPTIKLDKDFGSENMLMPGELEHYDNSDIDDLFEHLDHDEGDSDDGNFPRLR